MLISEAIARARALTGQSVETADLVRWLSEADGQLALELTGDQRAPYDPTDDQGTALLVPFPWDGFYVHRLEAMTYYAVGEYERYESARIMGERTLRDYRAYLQRTGALRGRPGFAFAAAGGEAAP